VSLEQPAVESAAPADGRRRGGRGDGSVLADALVAVRALDAEETVDGVLSRLCKSLVFIVGVTACSTSRVVGGYLVDVAEHALREVWLGHEAAYRISDFPLTAETLSTGESRAISFVDSEVEPSEAFILRDFNMNAMLMVPLRVRGRPWGLVELYEMRLRRFSEDDVSISQFLATHAERRIEALASSQKPRQRPPVYELPPDAESPARPRTR
jgi:GAF domain-containing protein